MLSPALCISAAEIERDLPENLSNRIVTAYLILREPPAADIWLRETKHRGAAAATLLTRQHLAAIDIAHAALRGKLVALGARETGRFRKLANAVRVRVSADKLAALSALPGVTRVEQARIYHRATSTSVPHSGAPVVWTSRSSQADGAGIRVGIIDSGIDYTHAIFGGAGTAEAFFANDGTVIEPGTFPTDKVIGGFDFAGDDYNPDDRAHDDPQPDPDPLDVAGGDGGHGTAVAGIVSGFGVVTNGATYTGSYSNILDPASFSIGPGIAPRALLYALKVFGATGGTALVPDALEWAADPDGDGDFTDRLDVVNFSIIGTFGIVSREDLDLAAVNRLVGLGCVVVGSAGNYGNTFYIGGGPASVPRVITVANLSDFSGAIQITSPSAIAGNYHSIPADFGPYLESVGPIAAPIIYVEPRDACEPLVNAAALAGKIALIDRGTCMFADKVFRAQEAGAIAVIVVNNIPGPPIVMGGGDSPERVTIPSVMISQADGALLKNALAANSVSARLDPSLQHPDDLVHDTVVASSSRGPLAPDHLLKPEISAPGQGVFSALVATGTLGEPFGGTSSAAPHVAGAAALLKQLHPTWSPEDIKAALMNTASGVHDTNDVQYPESRVGAGRLQVDRASVIPVTAAADATDGRVALTFGALEFVGPATVTKRVKLTNHGADPIAFTIAVSNTVTETGVSVAPNPSTITVPALSSATVDIALSATPTFFDRTLDLTTPALLDDRPRAGIYEVSGQVWFHHPTATIHLPYYAVVRAASAFNSPDNISWPSDSIANIPTAGTSAHPEPLVSAFQLGFLTNSLNLDSPANAPADLIAAGAACNFASVNHFTNSLVFFGLVIAQPWTTPQNYNVDFIIDIDTDFDGEWDAYIYNTSFGNVIAGNFADGKTANDVFVTGVRRNGVTYPGTNLNFFAPNFRDTVLFNTRVLVQPVPVSSLGLTATNSRFAYAISTHGNSSVGNSLVTHTPWVTFDAARPGLDTARGLQGTPFFSDGRPITASVNRASFDAYSQQPAILLMHHMNTVSNQMEIVSFSPRVSITREADAILLTWPEPGPYTVQTSASIAPVASWQDLTTTATNKYRIQALSSGPRFFRLLSQF